MIKLFMRDHTIVDISNKNQLNKINRDDVKFYSIPLKSSFKEPICMLFTNVDVLFDFEYAILDFQTCASTYETPIEADDIIDGFVYMPPIRNTYIGISGFVDMISYLFSFRRMIMCNVRIYDASYTNSDLFYYVLSRFSLSIKYDTLSMITPICDYDFIGNISGELSGDELSGLNVIVLFMDEFFGRRNSSRYSLSSGVTVMDNDGRTSVRSNKIISPYTKYLTTTNNETWRMKYPDDFIGDEICYTDLFVTDAVLIMPVEDMYDIDGNMSVYYTMDMNSHSGTNLELDTEDSPAYVSIYILEKIIFTVSSLYYLRALILLVTGIDARNNKMDFFGATITLFSPDNNDDEITLEITEDSKNVLESFCAVVKSCK